MCKIPSTPLWGGGILRCEERKEISWLWGRIYRGQKGRMKQYPLPFDIEAVGKNIKWSKGRGKKSRFQNGGGEEYQVVENFIHPCKIY